MTSPVPGFLAPSPRTWSQGDFLTTPRLRGDMTNFGSLVAAQGRPILIASIASGFALSSGVITVLPFNSAIISLNTWNVPIVNAAKTNAYYQIPLAGWYLCQGDVSYILNGTPQANKFCMGFDAVINGAAAINMDGGGAPASNTVANGGSAGCELIQFNTFSNSADTLALYSFTNGTGQKVQVGAIIAEWVGLPSFGATLTGYTGPYGTVVTSPALSLPFPAGPGTTLTAPVSAGATSITVNDPTGMITGGTLGLDYLNGDRYQDYAEPVSITSVTANTIGISACVYSHLSGAPVAVPASAAFMNQQSRDLINFMSYPPMMRAVQTQAQSIPSSGFPGTTQVNSLSANIDNFSGFSSNTYTVPVSGVYLVYGQVYYNVPTAGTVAGAGIQISGGTTLWGTVWRFAGGTGETLAATVRRNLRLTAGQTIELIAYQGGGTTIPTEVSLPNQSSKMIIAFRSF